MARKKKKEESSPETSKVNQNVKNALMDIEMEASIFLSDEAESDGFLPEPTPEVEAELEAESSESHEAQDDASIEAASETKASGKKSARGQAKGKSKAKSKSKNKMKAASSETDSNETDETSNDDNDASTENESLSEAELAFKAANKNAQSISDEEEILEASAYTASETDGEAQEDEELFEASEEMENKEIQENEEGSLLEAAMENEDAADADAEENEAVDADLEGTELDGFESADIEEVEFVEEEQLHSIIESILFASDRPVSLASIQLVFKGTNVRKDKIRRVLDTLAVEYASGRRGVVLEEVTGGYQLRTKVDNMNFIKRTIKTKAFKLSGPALETLSIVAYKQPVVKVEIDQIRGVESGHLLRALMEKGLVNFEGKAETLPGKPMQYGTTRRFLEIFGLRNLKELPTLSQIDELLPEGIGDENEEKETLSMVTDSMAEEHKAVSYSEGEEELGQIEEQLTSISTSSEFFEQEKLRQKQKRDEEKAQNIREALAVGETVSKRDLNWLKKFENPEPAVTDVSAEGSASNTEASNSPSEGAAELDLADQSVDENSELNEELDEAEDADSEHRYDLAEKDSDSDESDDEDDELPFYDEADESPEEGHV